jgi:cobalt-zinc-cadmium efflux system protein
MSSNLSKHDHQRAHQHTHGDGHNHSHTPEVSSDNERQIFLAMLLTGGFMVVEVVGGIVSGSLALIADAGHMATDAAALLLAWMAFRLSRRPADDHRSYGYYRGEVLAAFINGVAMLALVVWIIYEALHRLFAPTPVLGGIMLWIAVVGLLVNCVSFALLQAGDKDNLNIRGAMVHVAGDLLGSVAAIIAAGVIIATGWTPIDPLLSLFVAALIARSAWKITRDAAHIMMEGTPAAIDYQAIKDDLLENIEGLEHVHHMHIWALTQERPIATLHARISENSDGEKMLHRIHARLKAEHRIDHSTIQIERGDCP